MPSEVTGIDNTNICEFCDCLFCKKGPLGSNNCTVKVACNSDGKCPKPILHNTCPWFDSKY